MLKPVVPIKSSVIAADTQNAESILDSVLKKMSEMVAESQSGTIAGEWSVLCLAQSGFYDLNNSFFEEYYNSIVNFVNETAANVNMNGALHKTKSTENSRLIIALSAIGRDAQSVGNYNLTEPYNDFNWVKKQGLNGPIFALIALDTNNYQINDTSIRQQCIDFILEKELENGGWALSGSTADADITAMALQSLARYRDSADVDAAVERGINILSEMQNENGSYSSFGVVSSDSTAQVITACTVLEINPDTDERFVKNGSAVEALLGFYDNSSEMFCHTVDDGENAMSTNQCSLALIAYQHLQNGENPLFDMTDCFENAQQNITHASLDLNGDGIVNAQDILNAPNEKKANEIAEIFLHGKAAENK